MDIKVTAFPAETGESILIECFGQKKTNILIDLGFSKTYNKFIKKKLQLLADNEEKIDLLILSHYDADHIEGAIAFFEDLSSNPYINIEEIWINDFLAVSSLYIHTDNLSKSQNILYEFSKFIMKAYRTDSSTYLKSEISRQDSVTITKLMIKLGYNNKVNRSFAEKIACVKNNSRDKVIKINNEINISLISPKEDSLQTIMHDFLKWFDKNNTIYSNFGQEELFELFLVNYDDNMKQDITETIKREPVAISNYKQIVNKIINSEEQFSDKSPANRSSIAFSMKFNEYNLMFTGDIDTQTIIDGNQYNTLKYDLFKVSHHGSKNNTNRMLLNTIDCPNYLICTNGKGKSKHPDLETIVYIAEKGSRNIYMNYPLNRVNISQGIIEELTNTYSLNIIAPDNRDEQSLELIFKGGELDWKAITF